LIIPQPEGRYRQYRKERWCASTPKQVVKMADGKLQATGELKLGRNAGGR
jgi:hypothetical protein